MMENSSFVFLSYPINIIPHTTLDVFIDHLKTVSLRPTWMYGEADERFFPTIMRLADRWNGQIPRIAEGGKKQMSYVGEFLFDFSCCPLKI